MSNLNDKTLRDDVWRVALREQIKAKDRNAIERIDASEAKASTRYKNYDEVINTFTVGQARNEAQRCLDCVKPTCKEGCPVGIDIPGFIKYVEVGKFGESIATIKNSSTFPAICGRVCPQETQCEAKCFYRLKLNKPAVSIGNLERFVADYSLNRKNSTFKLPDNNADMVAVIGSGPAALAAAGDLAKYGYRVTIFEALHDFGGVLKYGIPEFRLPNNIVNKEIENLHLLGVEFVNNFIVGKTATIEDLKKEGYKVFFIGSGAGLPKFMGIPGENYNGILSSNEYLTRVNLMHANETEYDTPVLKGKRVAVIGGGNTAMDSVRTARRLGAEKAIVIYRRSFDEMPARKEEVRHAIEEGVEFINLTIPIRYHADKTGRVNNIVVRKMQIGEPDTSGRLSTVEIADSDYEIDIDMAIVSIGVSPNPIVPKSVMHLEVSEHGTITVNPDTMETNIPGLFAGGDIVRGGATVILAMGDGRKAAKGMHEYIQRLDKNPNTKK
jgi:glutamate synthase (NADPH/NADH) small chain